MRIPTALAAPARILMANSGHVYLADYDGAQFTTTLNQSLPDTSTSWLAFVEPNLLYAVNEISTNTLLYHLDLDANTIEQADSQQASSGVVHLEFNLDNTRMVGAAYGAGAVDIWNTEDGGLELMKTIQSDDPLGPNPDRQDQAHCHGSALDPTGRYFAVQDLGTDTILLIDSQDDAFEVVNHVAVEPAGAGPRHGAFFPVGAEKATHYMVVCELKNLLLVYSLEYGTDEGITFTQTQVMSTFGPDGAPDGAGAGEIVIAQDNKHVYASNRITGDATDNIAHFTVGDDATLSYVASISTGGTLPRMFSITDDGQELLVGNQDGAVGAAALFRNDDGSVDVVPRGAINAPAFGEAGFGPQFIKQIA